MIGLRPHIVFCHQLLTNALITKADLGAVQVRFPLLRSALARRLSKQVNALVIQVLDALPYWDATRVL